MANTKFSTDVHLGKIELNKWKEFLTTKGYQKLFLNTSASFGIVYTTNLERFLSFLIMAGTNTGTVKLTNTSLAVDKDANLIELKPFDNLEIPDNGLWNYLVIKHQYSHAEEGTVSVDSNGNLTGIGTKFTQTLRGGAKFPSKIRFIGASANVQDYEVVEVSSDTSAVISGVLASESNIQFGVVGTFSYGSVPTSNDKMIFQHDSCNLQVLPEVNGGAPATIAGKEFIIARVKLVNGNVVIEDKRKDYYSTQTEDLLQRIPSAVPLVGIEAVKFDQTNATKDRNIVEIGFGFRFKNWTINSTLRQITISGGSGGRFKDTNQFADNDFTGWRLYAKDGSYELVQASVKSFNQINVILEKLDVSKYTAGEELVLVPDAEQVEFKFKNSTFTQLEEVHSVNINTGIARIKLLALGSAYSYSVVYRFKNHNAYTNWFNFAEDINGFYNEASFDANGVLVVTPTRVPYTGVGEFLNLKMDGNAYRSFAEKIDLGDKLGVQHRTINTTQPVVTLTVGTDKQHQIFTGSGSMTADFVINLSKTGAKEGNVFYIDLKGGINHGAYNLTVNSDYQTAGAVGAVLKRLTPTEFNYMAIPRRKVSMKAVYDGAEWNLTVIETDKGRLGKTESQNHVNGGDFDATGKGISEEFLGYALCNGNNGTPDLRGRFIVGQNAADGTFDTIGKTGGQKETTLTMPNIPPHQHEINYNHDGDYADGGTGAVEDIKSAGESGADRTKYTGWAGGTNGATIPFTNLPPYYVQAYVMRIPYVA